MKSNKPGKFFFLIRLDYNGNQPNVFHLTRKRVEACSAVRNACKVAELSNFVDNKINNKSFDPTRPFCNLWSLVML